MKELSAVAYNVKPESQVTWKYSVIVIFCGHPGLFQLLAHTQTALGAAGILTP